MRIAKIETFAADGGLRRLHFLKITTDQGLVGWSEFGDGRPGLGGLARLIAKIGEWVIGQDPRACGRLVTDLYAAIRFAHAGLNAQAIAAIENACLDIKAKALGCAVHELFGGALRDNIPVYWSQCGMHRVLSPEFCQQHALRTLRSLADVEALGAEVRERGFSALKTKIMRFGTHADSASVHMPGFAPVGAGPALNATLEILSDVEGLISAFRAGAGPDVEIILDANFNFRTEGFIRVARVLERHNVRWLEADVLHPATLATIRRSTRTPIGSLEAVLGRRAFLPFLEQQAVDVAIIDVMWNGFTESLAMAALADAYETSVALHNYAGSLAATIGAHFAALIPNLTTMEIEVDGVQQCDALLKDPPRVELGFFQLPKGPGWGCEVDEAALARHVVVQ